MVGFQVECSRLRAVQDMDDFAQRGPDPLEVLGGLRFPPVLARAVRVPALRADEFRKRHRLTSLAAQESDSPGAGV